MPQFHTLYNAIAVRGPDEPGIPLGGDAAPRVGIHLRRADLVPSALEILRPVLELRLRHRRQAAQPEADRCRQIVHGQRRRSPGAGGSGRQ